MDKKDQLWIIKHPNSRYGVINAMESEIASCHFHTIAFQQLHRKSKEYLEQIELFESEKISLLARFVINHTISDDLFYELYGVPHISYLLDSIAHFPRMFSPNYKPSSVVAFVDGDSQTMYEEMTGSKAYWVPHAIDAKKIENRLQEKQIWNIPYDKRMIDLTISGSWIDWKKEDSFWQENMSIRTYEIMKHIADMVLLPSSRENHIPILSRFLKSDSSFQKEIFALFSEDISLLYVSLEQYIRGLDRERLCNTLSKFLGSITVLTHKKDTAFWREALGNNPQVEYREEISYEETWDYYAQSRIVMNSVPTIKKGLHERLLAALFCSAKVITTFSSLLPQGKYRWEKSVCIDRNTITTEKDVMNLLHVDYPKERDKEEIWNWIYTHHTWQKRCDRYFQELFNEVYVIQKKRSLSMSSI